MSKNEKEILDMIQIDMEEDAKHFDGQPFTGKNVSEYFGKQSAAIAALANILSKNLKG